MAGEQSLDGKIEDLEDKLILALAQEDNIWSAADCNTPGMDNPVVIVFINGSIRGKVALTLDSSSRSSKIVVRLPGKDGDEIASYLYPYHGKHRAGLLFRIFDKFQDCLRKQDLEFKDLEKQLKASNLEMVLTGTGL